MQRRKFSREFKVEAVRLIEERGVSAAQAARDLDVHENVLRKWVRELASDPPSDPGPAGVCFLVPPSRIAEHFGRSRVSTSWTHRGARQL